LAEHRGFGFDTADAPREHAETVDHRRVRIGAHAAIGIRLARALFAQARAARTEHDPRQELDVDLMHDARIGRHGTEIIECGLAPFEERVAFAVAIEFESRVFGQRVARTEAVDLDRVIDHELDRLQRVDRFRVAAEGRHRVAHGGQIDHRRDAREILQQDAARPVRDLARAGRSRRPACERGDVVARDAAAVFEAQQILEQNLDAIGQPRRPRIPRV
jgi:hypothetical protein